MKYFFITTGVVLSLGLVIWGVFIIQPKISFAQSQLEVNNVNDMSISGRQILSWINQLSDIKFNTALFKDLRYTNLQDFTVDISKQDIGRTNPFLPASSILRTQAVNVPALNLPRAR